jgi:hypothetical protein
VGGRPGNIRLRRHAFYEITPFISNSLFATLSPRVLEVIFAFL